MTLRLCSPNYLNKLLQKNKHILSAFASLRTSNNTLCISNKRSEKQNVKFGIMFDIDGVLLRGVTPISEAKHVITSLVNSQSREFNVPCLFCTNAFGMKDVKAGTLSKCFDVLVSLNPGHLLIITVLVYL